MLDLGTELGAIPLMILAGYHLPVLESRHSRKLPEGPDSGAPLMVHSHHSRCPTLTDWGVVRIPRADTTLFPDQTLTDHPTGGRPGHLRTSSPEVGMLGAPIIESHHMPDTRTSPPRRILGGLCIGVC